MTWLSLLIPLGHAFAGRDVQVRHVGAMIDGQGNRAHIVGQDEAYSVSLGKSVLWLYGDTFYGRRRPNGKPDIEGAVTNSAALTLDDDASDGITGIMPLVDANDNPRAVLPYDPAEKPADLRLWPGHGIKLGGKIYLYYSLVDITGPGDWDFKHAGQGLAVGEDPHQSFTRLKRADLYEFWTREEPRFGVAVIQGKDGWVYVYGRREDRPNALHLARVRPEAIERLDAYEYLASSRTAAWTTQLSSAAAIFMDAPPEASVSYNQYLGQFLMLYSRFLEKDVVIRTAPHAWGPWTRPRPIYHCKPSKPDAYCYAAKEHPEYAGGGGRRVYFTVVDSGEAEGGVPELFEATFRPTPAPTTAEHVHKKTHENQLPH
ncbi:MAG: DUF4185 domain-containing protein [Elusimicrobia bacterium]|nr:DUF4185 domain-containing protein [Elusimicrobiota bacterium]